MSDKRAPYLILLASASAGAMPAPPLVPPTATAPDVFAAFLANDVPPADGFDFPVGDAEGQGAYTNPVSKRTYSGWRVSTQFGEVISLGLHPGEDWNGVGGGNTDLGQPVHAVAAGRVAVAEDAGVLWGNVVVIEHLFYENHQKKRLRSLYAHLDRVDVQVAQTVTRRQVIGSIGRDPDRSYLAHLHLELRWEQSLATTFWPTSAGWSAGQIERAYAAPSAFIRAHRHLFVPQAEERLVLVDQASFQMQVIVDRKVIGTYPVAFGQSEERKRRRGDNRTPQGMYFVVSRHRGAFGGEWAEYFGGHWIKVNYPNAFDARFGREQGWIKATQEQAIGAAWRARQATDSRTVLGGGIGFHGWIDNWPLDGPRRLSWGCIVMQNADIAAIYELLREGTMVVVF